MPDERIEFRGRYEYADSAALERALASVRVKLHEDDLPEADAWLRHFVRRGNRLTVRVTTPASSEHRFVAANMFLILAQSAIDGSVQVLHGSREVDRFVAGIED